MLKLEESLRAEGSRAVADPKLPATLSQEVPETHTATPAAILDRQLEP